MEGAASFNWILSGIALSLIQHLWYHQVWFVETDLMVFFGRNSR
jgi:hypothetical protein